MTVRATLTYGLVLRRGALAARNVRLASVLSALEVLEPLDEDGELLTFGPFFGEETLTVVHRRLVELGLIYVDDFFDLFMDHPDWLEFRLGFVSPIPK